MRQHKLCRTAALRVIFILLALTSCASLFLAQESRPKDGRYYEQQARKAYQEKNYAAFLENMKRAASLRPEQPRLMYNLAVAYALNGDGGRALLWLGKVARMGLVYPAESDTDFNSIRETVEFKAVLAKFRENREPVIRSARAFSVDQKGLITESVAFDPRAATFYLSSVHKRKIISVSRGREVKDFLTERDGLWSVMGMKVDARRRHLWACTVSHPQMINYREEEGVRSALLKVDLRTGRIVQRYELPAKPAAHWHGDLAHNPEGDVFTTDSVTPAVYVLRRGSDKLEVFYQGEPFVSPQGLDFSSDGESLYVADYARGIFIIDLKTRKLTAVSPALDSTLIGIDGLYVYKRDLVGVQNGTNPQRLVRVRLSRDGARAERVEVMEANNPVMDEPTLGVIVKHEFYFVANSQWGAIDKTGQLSHPEKLQDPVVLKIRL